MARNYPQRGGVDLDTLIQNLQQHGHNENYLSEQLIADAGRPAESRLARLAHNHQISDEALEAIFERTRNTNDANALKRLATEFERSEMNGMQLLKSNAAEYTERTGLNKVGNAAKKITGKTFGGLKSMGKWVGLATAGVAGAVVLSSALSSKRHASAEKLANEPPPAPDMNAGFVPMAQPNTMMGMPPTPGDWAARVGGGAEPPMYRQPEQMVMPASHVEAVQNRAEDPSVSLSA